MAEMAKIELSSDETVKIEGETGLNDDNGEEIYIDVEINREDFDAAVGGLVTKAIATTQATIKKSGLTANDINKIIFIGGPTNYKLIRDKVVEELGIPGSIEVNPMTAVSEGAAMYAESVDWTSQEHERKSTREQFNSDTELGLSFRYESRTPDKNARIAVALEKEIVGYTFEINSVDSGWNSGLMALNNNALVTVPLYKRGENKFLVEVYDKGGDAVFLEDNKIVITQTFANVGALLAPHSIGIEVKERLGSNVSRLEYLVREGDTLPAKGQKKFRSIKKVRAGSNDSINFKLYQGEIEDKIEDNLFIGALKISGEDFRFGTILEGTEIICNYTIDDAGSIDLDVDIPAIAESFYKNFYSREEGQVNFDKASDKLNSDGKNLLEEVRQIGKAVENNDDYEKLQRAGEVASTAISANQNEQDREELKHIEEDLQEAKKVLADIRQRNKQKIRRDELINLSEYYKSYVEKSTMSQDREQFENLFERAESLIERDDSAFEDTLEEIRALSWKIIFFNDDEYVVYVFHDMTTNPDEYDDKARFYRLATAGREFIAQENYNELRKVIAELFILSGRTEDELLIANIIKA